MNIEEKLGKAAYETFRLHCHGYTKDWEHLSKSSQQAWMLVAAAVLAENKRNL